MSSEDDVEAHVDTSAPDAEFASFPFVNGVPRLKLFLLQGEDHHLIEAIVDSGADRSLFPLSVAKELGIEKSLTKNPVKRIGAGGRRFRVWSRADPVEGHLVLVANARQVVGGPLLRLTPVFAECDHAILGRDDFFTHFTITFTRDLQPRIELRWGGGF